MNLWQANKLFLIISGLLLIGLIVLWPSLFGVGATVVRLDRTEYDRIMFERRRLKDSIEHFYPGKDEGESGGPRRKAVEPVANALQRAFSGNKVLLANFGEMHHWMSFVPRFPFRIPGSREKENERQRYVSHAYTYLRDGELICEEYGTALRVPTDGVVFLASTRNIRLGDPYLGLRDMEFPEKIKDPQTRVMQLALIHELGHLAIRAGVDEITSIAPAEPYPWSVKGVKVAQAYPVKVQIKCDLATLLAFLHALDGAHGRVTEVVLPADVADATIPLAPEREPGEPEGNRDDEEPRPAADAAERAPTKVTIELYGSPSLFTPRPEQGDLKERLTIFRAAKNEPHKLVFVANAIATSALGDGRIEAVVEPLSDICFLGEKKTQNLVQRGDFASTRFLLVRNMRVKAVEGTIKKDKDGFPLEVTPQHLEVELSVAALRFLKLEMPKGVTPRRRVKRKPPIYRRL